MKKLIGKVTELEKKEIQLLFERKNGLIELSKIINNDDDLYEKIVTDMGDTAIKFEHWWNKMSTKYNWESTKDGHWEIDFDNCDIYLVH